MTRPRRTSPEDRAAVERVLAEYEIPQAIIEKRDAPGRLVRNPCDDRSCPLCWGTPEEAEQVRRTGLRQHD